MAPPNERTPAVGGDRGAKDFQADISNPERRKARRFVKPASAQSLRLTGS
jgi:hypothetical protein